MELFQLASISLFTGLQALATDSVPSHYFKGTSLALHSSNVTELDVESRSLGFFRFSADLCENFLTKT